MNESPIVLACEDVTLGYEHKPPRAHRARTVRAGDYRGIVGENGSGKSTLLRCINALEPTQSGRVRLGNETVAYGGKGLTSLRQRIGMVFQR